MKEKIMNLLQINQIKQHQINDTIKKELVENQESIFDKTNNFHKEMIDYDRIQYYNIYNSRIQLLKPLIAKSIKKIYPEIKINDDLLQAKGLEMQAIIGIIHKTMPSRPNVLKGMDSITQSRNVESFISSKDEVFIEGVSGRLKLKFIDFSNSNENEKTKNRVINRNLNDASFFSGIVCGIM